MHTTGDGTDPRFQGHMRGKGIQSSGHEGASIDNLLGVVGEGLRPMRMEPLPLSSGLEPVEFTRGLDELDTETMRMGGRIVTARRRPGEAEALEAAQKRANEMGFLE